MKQQKSFFGPLLLIAAGVIWLLVSADVIPSSNLWALTHLWPYLLIAAGLGLILRSFWKYTSILLDVLIIGGAVLAIVFAPQLGWANPSMFAFISNGEPFFGPGEPGSGNVVTETREVSGFTGIKLDYPAQVSISQGEVESVKIEAEDNLLPGLHTQVTNGQLRVFYRSGDGPHINPTHSVKITIVVKDLSDLEFTTAGELNLSGIQTDHLDISLSGAGNMNLDHIRVRELSLSLSGAGSMNASGTADDLHLNISGFGGFDGGELHSQSGDVSISGAGSATVWTDDDLSVEISGAGSVNYYGPANVTRRISGLGGVNHLGDK